MRNGEKLPKRITQSQNNQHNISEEALYIKHHVITIVHNNEHQNCSDSTYNETPRAVKKMIRQ